MKTAAAEELLVMVGNELEPAAAEVAEAEVAEVLKLAVNSERSSFRDDAISSFSKKRSSHT